MPVPVLQLDHVGKRFGDAPPVVRDLSLSVRPGEFLTLLGPSGCGKSTTLRMIAGLEAPSEGRILLHGRDITADPPWRRPVNTVFQDYALFPHMSVRGNVGFGLAMQRVSRAEQARRVDAMLALVGLSAQAGQRPATLSGGQRQRVALARALVTEPAVLLLDEPLSALDAERRGLMQAELKALQARLAATFVLVTHDQTEALALSNRVALLREGTLVQLDTPQALYDRPADAAAARFLGAANLLAARFDDDGAAAVLEGGARMRIALPAPGAGPRVLCIRPEHVEQGAPGGENTLAATLRRVLFQGSHHRLQLTGPDDTPIIADLPRGHPVPSPGSTLILHLPPDRLLALPA